MKIKSLGVIIFYISVGIPFSLFADDLKVLRTAAQESYPKYYKLSDHTMGGICVDIIQAIEKVDSEIKFNGYQKFLPFKRLQLYLENGQLDVFLGLKKTEERIEKFIFLDIPLYTINYVLAVRTENSIMINSFDDIRSLGENGIVLTVFGTAASNFLQKQKGLLVDDKARDPFVAIKKLIAERGYFVFYHDLGLKSIIERENLEKEIQILPVSFLTYSHYAAFSKNIPPERIDRIKSSLEKIDENGELTRIRRKYGLIK